MHDRGEVGGAGAPRRADLWVLLATLVVATAIGAWAALPALASDEPTYGAQVVGGTSVPTGKYPFMASLQDETRSYGPPRGHFCGGTLVARQYVLTAAHCADFIRDNVPLRKLRVVVGATVLNGKQGQTRAVTGVSVHPRFNGGTYEHDAAVLRLDRPVRGIEPIALAPPGAEGDAYERPGSRARVAGWGNRVGQSPSFGEPDRYPSRMREARPPLVSDRDCGRAYGKSFNASVEVCAGAAGVDTCQGDSGGPMFVATSGGFAQIGITSYGRGCGAEGYPGVYAEVNADPIRDFIEGATGGGARSVARPDAA